MLLCGIVDELIADDSNNWISSFFCQATSDKKNYGSAVLRGLIYILVRDNPALMKHVREESDQGGQHQRIQGYNAWQALSTILTNILQDDTLDANIVLIVDALDECAADRHRLLDFIIRTAAASSCRWIVASRNWDDIKRKLDTPQHTTLHLELNEDVLAEAVRIYIRQKVTASPS